MMADYMTDDERKVWEAMAADWKEVGTILSRIRNTALLNDILDERVLRVIDNANDICGGQAYMFTPQGEWMGGDTWKTRFPHIVGQRRPA